MTLMNRIITRPQGTVLASSSINAAQETSEIDCSEYSEIDFQVDYTYDSATYVKFTPYVSHDGGTTWRNVVGLDGNTGSVFEPQFSVSGDLSISLPVTIKSAGLVKLKIESDGGAGDTVVVGAALSRGW